MLLTIVNEIGDVSGWLASSAMRGFPDQITNMSHSSSVRVRSSEANLDSFDARWAAIESNVTRNDTTFVVAGNTRRVPTFATYEAAAASGALRSEDRPGVG